jgi:hypothetical protein
MSSDLTAYVQLKPRPFCDPECPDNPMYLQALVDHEHSVAVAIREGLSAIINDCVNNHECNWTIEHDGKTVALWRRIRESGWKA